MKKFSFLICRILVISGQFLAAAAQPGVDVAAVDRGRILQAANAALDMAPVTITQFRAKLSTGGSNDFYSNGDYWWPDPDKPDGLPYIQRDGQTNPENFNRHRLAIRQLRDGVAALGAAYQLTGDERYADKAAELLRVFFLDPATRMNPHLRFAQAVPGRSPGRGVGIIDTLHLIEVPVAIGALQNSRAIPPETLAGLKQWFGDYLEWMITSRNGQEEAAAKNNHAVAFWLQAAVFARFSGDEVCLAEARRQFKDVFVPEQMAADGSFPAELKRTKPYGYSIFQLDNMATLCQVLTTPTENLWAFESPDGRGIRKAMAYLYPFLADKTKWPLKPDVQAWDTWPARPPGLLFAGLALGEKPWLELWEKLPPDPADPEVQRNIAITQPVLWLYIAPRRAQAPVRNPEIHEYRKYQSHASESNPAPFFSQRHARSGRVFRGRLKPIVCPENRQERRQGQARVLRHRQPRRRCGQFPPCHRPLRDRRALRYGHGCAAYAGHPEKIPGRGALRTS